MHLRRCELSCSSSGACKSKQREQSPRAAHTRRFVRAATPRVNSSNTQQMPATRTCTAKGALLTPRTSGQCANVKLESEWGGAGVRRQRQQARRPLRGAQEGTGHPEWQRRGAQIPEMRPGQRVAGRLLQLYAWVANRQQQQWKTESTGIS